MVVSAAAWIRSEWLAGCCGLVLVASAGQALGQVAGDPVPNQLLVKYVPGGMPAGVSRALPTWSGAEIRPFLREGLLLSSHPITQWAHVILPPGTNDASALAAFASDPAVELVVPNTYGELLAIPNDPQFAQQWGLHNTGQSGGTPGSDVDAVAAWDMQSGDESVVVAIVDTGIDYHHPDLAANMWRNPGEIPANGIDDDGNGVIDDVFGASFVGAGFVAPSGDPRDADAGSHGTHVAGIVGAVANNGVGTAGVAWNVRLMAVKWIGQGLFGPTGTCEGAIYSIIYATLMGADVINASWRNPCGAPLRDAIRFAGSQNVLFVAAAGNDGDNNDLVPVEPAGFRVLNVIAVAASDELDQRAVFSSFQSSNFGPNRVQIAAPGKQILSTLRNGGYGYASGSSMAAPHVAGVAALIFARHPGIAAKDVKTSLVLGGDQLIGLDGLVLQGRRLNARGALLNSDAWVGAPGNPWACDDGIDNDEDGLVDHPADPGCNAVFPDGSESSSCGSGFQVALLAPLVFPLRSGLRRTRSRLRDAVGRVSGEERSERTP